MVMGVIQSITLGHLLTELQWNVDMCWCWHNGLQMVVSMTLLAHDLHLRVPESSCRVRLPGHSFGDLRHLQLLANTMDPSFTIRRCYKLRIPTRRGGHSRWASCRDEGSPPTVAPQRWGLTLMSWTYDHWWALYQKAPPPWVGVEASLALVIVLNLKRLCTVAPCRRLW
jgi:hypothetical protein